MNMRRLTPATAAILVTAAVAVATAGCGGKDDNNAKAPLGSPERPLVAQPSGEEGAAATTREPGAPVLRTPAKGTSKPKAGATAGSPAKGASSTSSEAGAPGPNYQQLLADQSSRPTKRFSPCNLVTASEAGRIIGDAMQKPVEAPQGPTCVYRTRSGKRLIALAVQTTTFGRIKAQLDKPRITSVAGRAAYCGLYGQPMLYVPLSGGRVLSVSASCATAKRFAAKALPHL
jgi:hypothetical protein